MDSRTDSGTLYNPKECVTVVLGEFQTGHKGKDKGKFSCRTPISNSHTLIVKILIFLFKVQIIPPIFYLLQITNGLWSSTPWIEKDVKEDLWIIF